MNMPIEFWIGLIGGLGIGFMIGGRIGYEQGLAADVKKIKQALYLTRIFK